MTNSAAGGLEPKDLLHFVELNEFVSQWELLGFDNETDLWNLQNLIMRNPEIGNVVPGTGGLRKMRFGRSGDHIGKRGGVRVCYAHFKEYAIVLLVTVYGKNEKDDLTVVERKYIREYIDRSRAGLDRRKSKRGLPE
jgi:hypothetical protein